MADQPTLEQDLWEIAMWLDQERPGSPVAARLRAASDRLREEMADADVNVGIATREADSVGHAIFHTVSQCLQRINNGPAPAATPTTPDEQRCETCGGAFTFETMTDHGALCMPATPTTGMEPADMQRAYVDARERYLTHKGKCSRPGCGINAHGDGCADERRLYGACRDALRVRNHPAAPPAEPRCPTWCGWYQTDVAKLRPQPEHWSAANREDGRLYSYCTPACRDAGRCLHPGKDRP